MLPNGQNQFSPMLGLSGMGAGSPAGVSPFMQNYQGDQTFQDPNAWLNQNMTQTAGTGAPAATAAASQTPVTGTSQPSAATPLTAPTVTNPLSGGIIGGGTAATPSNPAQSTNSLLQLLQSLGLTGNVTQPAAATAAPATPAASNSNSGQSSLGSYINQLITAGG